MNFQDVLKKCQKKLTLNSYACEEKIKEELEKVPAEITSDEILNLYKKYKEAYLKENNVAKEAHSDFFAWHYYGRTCTYEYLYRLFALIYKEQINEIDYVDIQKLKKQSQAYKELVHKIDEKKKGLQEYKPSAYKSKLELLESLTKKED